MKSIYSNNLPARGAALAEPGIGRAKSAAPEELVVVIRDNSQDVTSDRRIGRSVSLDHAAQLLGVSRRTIYNRIRNGRLQTIRPDGGSQRVLLESFREGRCGAAESSRRSSSQSQ